MTHLSKKFYSSFLALLLVGLIFPISSYANIQTLDGLSGQDQTFVDDTNVTITPGGTQHTLGWSGVLSLLRGGTGTSTFASGGLVFSDGTKLTQNLSKLFWDNTNGFLGIGTASPSSALSVAGEISGENFVATSVGATSTFSGSVVIGNEGEGLFFKRENQTLHIIQDLHMLGGQRVVWFSQEEGGVFGPELASITSSSANVIELTPASALLSAFLDLNSLTSSRTFTFPDLPGTFGLREADQTWTGLNKFQANANSTVHIGSATKSGCLVIGDSDESGLTYVIANNGALTATTTKPSICQ